MLSLKIILNGEIRRVQVHTYELTLSYASLVETARSLFPSLNGQTFQFSWSDDEGDVVTCSTDAEVAEALRVMKSQQDTCKFTVVTSEVPKTKAAHEYITCDGCGVHPIVGVRYKCGVRDNFDLCEKCEAAKPQPYPMVKIVTPEQAPAAIFMTLREDQFPNQPERGFPPHGRWGAFPGRPPRGCPFFEGPRRGPPCNSGPGREWKPGCGRWRKECAANEFLEKAKTFWRKPSSEGGPPDDVKAAVSPFIEAADAFSKAFVSGALDETNPSGLEHAAVNTTASAVPSTSEEDRQLEEQLLSEAVRQSLEDQVHVPQAAPTTDSSLPQAKPVVPLMDKLAAAASSGSFSGSNSFNSSYMYTKYTPSATASISKPMARFIRDVSLSDGSVVAPGESVIKTWRVRNDGDRTWPEGVTLTFSSGDLLAPSPEHLIVNVPALKTNEETDISVRLSIPETTGRHVSYFRLRTKEGHIFGQRLWADLRVVDPEYDWVSSSVRESETSTPVASAVATPLAPPISALETTASTLVPASVSMSRVEGSALAATVSANPATVPTNKPPEDVIPSSAAPIPEPTVTSSAPAAASAPSPMEVWSKVWEKELQVLGAMGFTDTAALIPLLQEHVGLPVSLCPELNGVPPAEGLQKLVAVLLSRSGSFNF